MKFGNDFYFYGIEVFFERCFVGVYYLVIFEFVKERICSFFFGSGKVRVVIVFSFFSMGIDFFYVRYVIYFG